MDDARGTLCFSSTCYPPRATRSRAPLVRGGPGGLGARGDPGSASTPRLPVPRAPTGALARSHSSSATILRRTPRPAAPSTDSRGTTQRPAPCREFPMANKNADSTPSHPEETRVRGRPRIEGRGVRTTNPPIRRQVRRLTSIWRSYPGRAVAPGGLRRLRGIGRLHPVAFSEIHRDYYQIPVGRSTGADRGRGARRGASARATRRSSPRDAPGFAQGRRPTESVSRRDAFERRQRRQGAYDEDSVEQLGRGRARGDAELALRTAISRKQYKIPGGDQAPPDPARPGRQGLSAGTKGRGVDHLPLARLAATRVLNEPNTGALGRRHLPQDYLADDRKALERPSPRTVEVPKAGR